MLRPNLRTCASVHTSLACDLCIHFLRVASRELSMKIPTTPCSAMTWHLHLSTGSMSIGAFPSGQLARYSAHLESAWQSAHLRLGCDICAVISDGSSKQRIMHADVCSVMQFIEVVAPLLYTLQGNSKCACGTSPSGLCCH